jgi:hypothetical protein
MKPDRTIIRLAFPHPVYGTFTPVKVEYEYPLGPNDNDQDALDDGKARAEAWYNTRYPAIDAGYAPPSRNIEPSIAFVDNGQADAEFLAVKTTLEEINQYEKAATFLSKSAFRYHPELKAIVESKKTKE